MDRSKVRQMFQKILIANRGEIAVRIIQTCRRLGIRTVAVYAEDDRESVHVSLADETYLLPGSRLSETYLNQELIVGLALRAGAEAIHPGYGLLSENPVFASRVEEAGIGFIGATAAQISLMGEKTRAIEFVKTLGVPVIPGRTGTGSELLQACDSLTFPVLVKASGGGGGKGMQVVDKAADLPGALATAGRQAEEYFGNGSLFIENYLPHARHVEVQLMGDGRGKVVHLFERECSIQRRYQKLIEETPAAGIAEEIRTKLHAWAVQIAEACRYRGAGTVEFLVDGQGSCYFLEMNTRLQVEHPVTEMITGQDLVEWQLKIASGDDLPLRQSDIRCHGHAIEARICAEDPADQFKPSSGTITAVSIPGEARWDSYIREDMHLPVSYDSLIGKLIAHGSSRTEARERLAAALQKLLIGGVKTNQLFLQEVICSETFRTNKVTTCFLEEQAGNLLDSLKRKQKKVPEEALLAASLAHHYFRPVQKKDNWFNAGYWRIQTALQLSINNINYGVNVLQNSERYYLKINEKWSELADVHQEGRRVIFKLDDHFYEMGVYDHGNATVVQHEGYPFTVVRLSGSTVNRKQKGTLPDEKRSDIRAGLFGKVVDVLIRPGDLINKGQPVLVIESMKTEFTILSPVAATVRAVRVTKGKMVQDTEIVMDLES